MDTVRALAATFSSAALAAAGTLRTLIRGTGGWAVETATRQAEFVGILGQSLTLFFLGVLLGVLRRPEVRRLASRAHRLLQRS